MAVETVTPRYPMGVSRSNSQMRRIRDVAGVVTTALDMTPIRLLTCTDGAPSRRALSPRQVALKSSGETLSKNSLNFSTSSSRTAVEGSSSLSSGINRPASARTASST